jgi:hypothetical protein
VRSAVRLGQGNPAIASRRPQDVKPGLASHYEMTLEHIQAKYMAPLYPPPNSTARVCIDQFEPQHPLHYPVWVRPEAAEPCTTMGSPATRMNGKGCAGPGLPDYRFDQPGVVPGGVEPMPGPQRAYATEGWAMVLHSRDLCRVESKTRTVAERLDTCGSNTSFPSGIFWLL